MPNRAKRKQAIQKTGKLPQQKNDDFINTTAETAETILLKELFF